MPAALLQGASTLIASIRGAIPQFDTQVSSGKASSTASLVPMPVFAATARGSLSTGGTRHTVTPVSTVLGTGSNNAFNGNHHEIAVPLPTMMTLVDTYIESISWSGMLAGAACEIRNGNGQLLFRGVADQANDSEFTRVPIGRVARAGYQVPVLDSGQLLVIVGRTARNAFGGRG